MTHNAYSVGTALAANQHWTLLQQLGGGVRAINWDTHRKDGDTQIHLCHTNCKILDAGLFIDALKTLMGWMQANPNEVITVIFENVGNFAPADLAAVFKQTGADALVYQKTPEAPWPTVGDMIKSGKRLVLLSSPLSYDPSITWIMDEFKWGWENPYEYALPDNFSCSIDRPKKPLIVPPANTVYMMNHFLGSYLLGLDNLLVPNATGTAIVNTLDSLQKHFDMCVTQQNRRPNYIALDFVDIGQGMQAVLAFNGKNIGPDEAKDPVGVQSFTPSVPPPSPSAAGTGSAVGSGVAETDVEQAIKDTKNQQNDGKFSFKLGFGGAPHTVAPGLWSGLWSVVLVVGVLLVYEPIACA